MSNMAHLEKAFSAAFATISPNTIGDDKIAVSMAINAMTEYVKKHDLDVSFEDIEAKAKEGIAALNKADDSLSVLDSIKKVF